VNGEHGAYAEVLAAVEVMTDDERRVFLDWLQQQRRGGRHPQTAAAPRQQGDPVRIWRRIARRFRRRRLRAVDGGRRPWREGPHGG
jgi:hypothetical protein